MFASLNMIKFKKTVKAAVFISTLLGVSATSMGAYATNNYTANILGKVTGVRVYPSGAVLFQLSNMPTVSGCNNAYFAFDTNWSTDVTKLLLARLLSAYTTGENFNVGYDGVNCAPLGNYIYVEELGL